MNDTDTADIVKRIVGTWPMAPKGFLWTEALDDLDYAPALAAYTRLRDEVEEQRISIARFLATYRAIVNHGNTGRRHDTEPDDGPTMSFDEYITRTSWLAGTGSTTASAALDEWSTPFAQQMLNRLLGDSTSTPDEVDEAQA